MTRGIDDLVEHYCALLSEVDDWFARCLDASAGQIACRTGCSGCCRGLFDITLLDAALLKRGFAQLGGEVREAVLKKAALVHEDLQRRWPGFSAPYLLNELPQEEWMQMEGEAPCLLLDAEGRCLLYESRPMTCRLHGLPHVDLSGEIFDEDFCTLNFPDANPLALPELRWEFRRLFERELALFQQFTTALYGRPLNERDTFIPLALLIEFDRIKTP